MAQLDLVISTAVGPYDLTALGTLDWFLFPASTTAVKKSGATYLSIGKVGTGFNDTTYNNGSQLTWSGGTPTASGSSTGGIFTYNGGTQIPLGAGYSVTAPADANVRTLRLFVNTYSGAMKVSATLSDGSSAAKIDNTTLAGAQNIGDPGYIVITYAAASAGQTLTVTLTIDDPSFTGRNVAMQGAALSGAAPAGGGITVSSVTVTPATATVEGGVKQQFSASVAGNNSPSQAVKWSTSAGTISEAGLLTAPFGTVSAQTVTVTATSAQDNTKSGTATVTIPATTLVVRTVTISLSLGKDSAGNDIPAANLTGAKVSFYDEPTPDLFGTARFQSASETTDASGVMTFTCQTMLTPGQSGGYVVRFADGKHFNGLAVVS
jgi:hypothetical protein